MVFEASNITYVQYRVIITVLQSIITQICSFWLQYYHSRVKGRGLGRDNDSTEIEATVVFEASNITYIQNRVIITVLQSIITQICSFWLQYYHSRDKGRGLGRDNDSTEIHNASVCQGTEYFFQTDYNE